ncbi:MULTISPECIES: alpha/beta hydrolase [Clostridium]|uniref:alpha/beta hydrolase n=1 Tax=Clostridium TaxID=1485 RepID=UPI001896B4F5|nr:MULTISPECIES: alpha/beta hydrolase [Clostridium]MCR1950064.1 alpha/beta hydrolase [Clostridium sp. DSM 100503]MDI9215538.1 alpha/beta hydrolase [Clostridium tertium]
MKKIYKLIVLFVVSFMTTSLIIAFYFKGAILITFDIIKDLKDSNKSVATLSELTDYYCSTSMDVRGLKYKESLSEDVFLDIYKSNITNKPSPVIIYVHGGSWIYGDNGIPIGLDPIINAFNKRGFSIISVSYELLKEDTPISNPVSDVKDAIRWVYKNKDEYNFDTNDIGLLGISSGAHLSLLSAYTSDDEFIGDKDLASYPSKVNYLIDIFGPTELSTLDFSVADKEFKDEIERLKEKSFLGDIYSPINYVDESSPSTLIIHSKNDELVPYTNSVDLYNKLKNQDVNTKLLSLNSGGHNFYGFENKEIVALIFEVFKFLTENTSL